jgi:hypothetical protein
MKSGSGKDCYAAMLSPVKLNGLTEHQLGSIDARIEAETPSGRQRVTT